MFAIIDIVDPYKGLYNISSKNMHYALDAMLRHNAMQRSTHSSDAAGEQVLTLSETTRPIKSEGTNPASSHEEPKGVRPT
jgi:hypothetical protein